MLANCRRCGRLYNRRGTEPCPTCLEEDEQAFLAVKAYVADRPDCTAEQVAADTGTPLDLVLRFLKQGRLVGLRQALHCERCGTPIGSGRFCPACQRKLASGLSAGGRVLTNGSAPDGARFVGAPRLTRNDDAK